MTAIWQRYAARFDALTLRERVMVFAALMVALLAFTYTLLIEPELVKQKRLAAALVQKHAEIKAFEAQVTKVVSARGPGRVESERERIARLRTEIAALEARIGTEERKFTAPSQMRTVMEGLLARNSGVALVEMKTLAAETVAPGSKPLAGERLIYRHGLQVSVSGSYLDLLAYARDLERLPRQLYWGALELDAGGYPTVLMKLTVYTLSLDPTWLSV